MDPILHPVVYGILGVLWWDELWSVDDMCRAVGGRPGVALCGPIWATKPPGRCLGAVGRLDAPERPGTRQDRRRQHHPAPPPNQQKTGRGQNSYTGQCITDRANATAPNPTTTPPLS